MTKKELLRWRRKVSAAQARVAKERDALRSLTAELEEVAESCDEAIDHLVDASDALSKLL